jgi:phthalate 4,5-dioxygenase oxygenase subunit
MLSREENDLLTRTGPGTTMGRLMRCYWIPALFSNQLPTPDGPPVRVKLLGEKLVAFRDTQGHVGLVDERCPHRTASLFFGRNEDCGLRCVYHGWKFDIEGNCVDLPSEPWDKDFKRKIKITAYPCIERGGLVWAYMGPPELKPEFPELEWTAVPASHRYVTRHLQECNWLQAVEGGFDVSHLSFLHRGTADSPDGTPFPLTTLYKAVVTESGFVAGNGRDLPGGKTFWATAVMFMPFHKLIPTTPFGAHVWVPIDDETTMNYSVEYAPDHALSDDELKDSKAFRFIHPELIEGSDRAALNLDNDYGIDRALQHSGKSYTGIFGLGIQDCSIQESMGPIADRTIEHLGVSDTAVIKLRRLYLSALRDFEKGIRPPGLGSDGYAMRATRFTLPPGKSIEDGIRDFVRINAAAVTS